MHMTFSSPTSTKCTYFYLVLEPTHKIIPDDKLNLET